MCTVPVFIFADSYFQAWILIPAVDDGLYCAVQGDCPHVKPFLGGYGTVVSVSRVCESLVSRHECKDKNKIQTWGYNNNMYLLFETETVLSWLDGSHEFTIQYCTDTLFPGLDFQPWIPALDDGPVHSPNGKPFWHKDRC